ncbi:hypothetical protein CO2235_MP70175 [Cupriavidus oxalaticus]|uniref:Uncharacterized protein n=1 Tax=Cupriavidus oxalaticus TaxID=96344 RepID=A0A976BK89_9BURK|nr:hypothetical protein CO2235_MP70175 [Cupriavidus oxalaticus]
MVTPALTPTLSRKREREQTISKLGHQGAGHRTPRCARLAPSPMSPQTYPCPLLAPLSRKREREHTTASLCHRATLTPQP